MLDPQQFTFASLPTFMQPGGFQVPDAVVTTLGFDPSTNWNSGDRPADILRIGTFRDVFNLERLDLQSIQAVTGVPMVNQSLRSLELMSWQSLETLSNAVSGLSALPAQAVQPIADLVNRAGGMVGTQVRQIGDLIRVSPELAQAPLGELLDLSQYSLASIPGLTTTSLDRFFQAGASHIAGVPGLESVPASQFPSPLSVPVGGLVVPIDVPLQRVEKHRTNSQPISGGQAVGFQVPCQEQCAHLEFARPIAGAQWMAGDAQQVPGGEGILGQTFGGQEPTGRHPYGPGFKVVVAQVNEATGTAETQLFFRFCSRTPWVDLGCTPYGIGPIPFLSHREKEPLFVGLSDWGSRSTTASTPVSASTTPPVPIARSAPTLPQPTRRWTVPVAVSGSEGFVHNSLSID